MTFQYPQKICLIKYEFDIHVFLFLQTYYFIFGLSPFPSKNTTISSKLLRFQGYDNQTRFFLNKGTPTHTYLLPYNLCKQHTQFYLLILHKILTHLFFIHQLPTDLSVFIHHLPTYILFYINYLPTYILLYINHLPTDLSVFIHHLPTYLLLYINYLPTHILLYINHIPTDLLVYIHHTYPLIYYST